MNAKDKLVTTRVRLQKDNPFFSYLVMGLELVEDKSVDTCAVDGKGNLFYNPEWVEKWDNEELKTVLAHEVLHIALQHLIRRGNRDAKIFNIANDMVVNNLLVNNGFHFGSLTGVIPSYNEFDIDGISIKDIDKKIAEEVYKELIKAEEEINQKNDKVNQVKKALEDAKEEGKQDSQSGEGAEGGEESESDEGGEGSEGSEGGEGKPSPLDNLKGFDEHKYSEKEETKEAKEETEKASKEWKKRLVEASTYAKMQGKLPEGMGRYVDKILENKLNWKALLHKYITKEIITDYTWSSPSKKSVALGTYLPNVKKEQVNITVAVDTSGSVSKDELTQFLSEIIGIAKGFANVKLHVLFADTKVNNHYIVNNGNTDEILEKEITGGGGTDFRLIYDYLDENVPETRLLVFFTDGYASFPESEFYKTVWVLTENGCSEEEIPFGEVIKLEDSEE